MRYIFTVKWGRNEILLNNFFYIHWCIVATVHNRAGAESFLHNRFVHNRTGAESFLHNRFVHNRPGAESFLYNRFVHNGPGAESFLNMRFMHNRAGALSFLHNWFVHNRASAESVACRIDTVLGYSRAQSVRDRSCWIDNVQNRAVHDRYHPDRITNKSSKPKVISRSIKAVAG